MSNVWLTICPVTRWKKSWEVKPEMQNLQVRPGPAQCKEQQLVQYSTIVMVRDRLAVLRRLCLKRLVGCEDEKNRVGTLSRRAVWYAHAHGHGSAATFL